MEKRSLKSTSVMKSPGRKSPVVKATMSKISMPRSPVPKSPIPKSPMPNSPMPKSPVVYEKYKSRCAYGLLSFFNFRHRRSKKLIADNERRRTSRQRLGGGYIRNKLDLRLQQSIEDYEKIAEIDSGNVKVIEVKGENGSPEQQTEKNTAAEAENVQSKLRKPRKTTKTARKAHRLPLYGCYDVSTMANANPADQNLADKSSETVGSGVAAEEINLQVSMSEATEALINQKLIDGKQICGDGKSQSKHFLGALEILNSNKDLFVKLLQDPSSLLVKHIEDLRGGEAKEQQIKTSVKTITEHHIDGARECKFSKSTETSERQPFENIVVLRPNNTNRDDSPLSRYSFRNIQQSVKPTFFSFEQMKRKLMRSMRIVREEKQLMLTNEAMPQRFIHDLEGFKGCGTRPSVEVLTRSDFAGTTASCWSIKRNVPVDKVTEHFPGIRQEAASRHQEGNKFDENAELCTDNFEIENESTSCSRMQWAKTCDGTSLASEHDGSISPKRTCSASSSQRMRSERSRRNSKEKKRSCSSPPRHKLEATPQIVGRKQQQMCEKISDNIYADVQVDKSIPSLNNDFSRSENECIGNTEEFPLEMPSEPDGSFKDQVNQSTEAADINEDNGSVEFSRMDSPAQNQTSASSAEDYSSSPVNSQGVGEFDAIKDNVDQPSPVSVLDQFFVEDSSNPLNTESQAAPPSVRRLHVGFDEACLAGFQSPLDLTINSSSLTEECRSMFKNISTMLQAYRPEWNEIAHKHDLSDQLLFDYVSEVFADACQSYSRCSPWLSFIKPSIISTMVTGNVLDEVMKNVDWTRLLAPPLHIQKITEQDLHKSGTWMDTRLDAEDVVSEIVDSLVEELTIEIPLE